MPPLVLTLALMSMAALSAPDEKAAFTAAGFTFTGKQWQQCAKAGGPGYEPGFTWIVDDLNRDGQIDAILSERGRACFGPATAGYWLVSKQPNGSWRVVTKGVGTVRVLDTRGAGGWPDLEIAAGPGTCFPVQRWNGKAYVTHRRAANGKPCR